MFGSAKAKDNDQIAPVKVCSYRVSQKEMKLWMPSRHTKSASESFEILHGLCPSSHFLLGREKNLKFYRVRRLRMRAPSPL